MSVGNAEEVVDGFVQAFDPVGTAADVHLAAEAVDSRIDPQQDVVRLGKVSHQRLFAQLADGFIAALDHKLDGDSSLIVNRIKNKKILNL